MHTFSALRVGAGIDLEEAQDLLGRSAVEIRSFETGALVPCARDLHVLKGMASVRRHMSAPEAGGRGVETTHTQRDMNGMLSIKTQEEEISQRPTAHEKAYCLHSSAPPKSWAGLLSRIGLESDFARLNVDKLVELYQRDQSNDAWYLLWEDHCSSYFDLDEADALLAAYRLTGHGKRLFFLQSYCRLLIVETLAELGFAIESNRPSLFGWLDLLPEGEISKLRLCIRGEVSKQNLVLEGNSKSISNFLSFLYQEIFPPRLRHLTGEHYTPSWLIDYCLSTIDPLPQDTPSLRVLDPAAGSGGFLAHLIEKVGRSFRYDDLEAIAIDVNPLAIEFC